MTTTGEFFRIRYGPGLEMLYAVVALAYLALSIALLLRGAGAAITGATGGLVPTEQSVILLSILFSSYVLAGGLVAAAVTDVLQGFMIIALSILLIPAGLARVGGLAGLHATLDPAFFAITAPTGSREGDPLFVLTMSLLGLVGVVVQPHVMSATGSGKTETEARVGMVYGNLIKRLLTIAWTFTGLIALAAFPEVLASLDPSEPAFKPTSETLFGLATRRFLGDGWRGLMIACLIAGVTSAETFMVAGAAVFTRDLYRPLVGPRSAGHDLWVGRVASAALLAAGVFLAFHASSVTQLVILSVQVIGLLGAAFWLGVIWRRANSAGVWASVLGSLATWLALSLNPATGDVHAPDDPRTILMVLGVEFGLLVLVSCLTPARDPSILNPFYARLHTPIGVENEVRFEEPGVSLPLAATLGLDGCPLDYRKSSRFAYARLQRLGIELPRLGWFDLGGFVAAWVLVAGLVGLLIWLSTLGR